MANQLFNIAKGRTVEYYSRIVSNDPANSAFILLLLQANEADAVLIDYDDLAAVLGAAGNTEATFTNYTRHTLTDAELAALPPPDDTANNYDLDLPDQTWVAAGGTLDNTLTKAILCFDSDTTGGTDANLIPVAHYDFAVTTDGSTLSLIWNAAGFFRAS